MFIQRSLGNYQILAVKMGTLMQPDCIVLKSLSPLTLFCHFAHYYPHFEVLACLPCLGKLL
jgi:hypothetical protein